MVKNKRDVARKLSSRIGSTSKIPLLLVRAQHLLPTESDTIHEEKMSKLPDITVYGGQT